MRRVGLKEFLSLPVGTVYREIFPNHGDGNDIQIKGNTLTPQNDWQELAVGNILSAMSETHRCPTSALCHMEQSSENSAPIYTDVWIRNGMYHNEGEIFFLIYEPADVLKIMTMLAGSLVMSEVDLDIDLEKEEVSKMQMTNDIVPTADAIEAAKHMVKTIGRRVAEVSVDDICGSDDTLVDDPHSGVLEAILPWARLTPSQKGVAKTVAETLDISKLRAKRSDTPVTKDPGDILKVMATIGSYFTEPSEPTSEEMSIPEDSNRLSFSDVSVDGILGTRTFGLYVDHNEVSILSTPENGYEDDYLFWNTESHDKLYGDVWTLPHHQSNCDIISNPSSPVLWIILFLAQLPDNTLVDIPTEPYPVTVRYNLTKNEEDCSFILTPKKEGRMDENGKWVVPPTSSERPTITVLYIGDKEFALLEQALFPGGKRPVEKLNSFFI